MTAIVKPLTLPVSANFDFLFLGIATVLLFIFMFIGKRNHLLKWQSMIFLLLYVGYIAFVLWRG